MSDTNTTRRGGIRVVAGPDDAGVWLTRAPLSGTERRWPGLAAARRVLRWMPWRLRPRLKWLAPLRPRLPDRALLVKRCYRTTRVFLVSAGALTGWSAAVTVALYPWPFLWAGGGVVVWAIRRRGRAGGEFGTAAWASQHELKAAGLLGGTGLGVGEVEAKPTLGQTLQDLVDPRVSDAAACDGLFDTRPRRHTVRLNTSPHVSVYAPTGSGKGQSLIQPFLLECPDTVIVLDGKDGENMRAVFRHRQAYFRRRQFWLDPFRVAHPDCDRLNPLDGVDPGSPHFIDDCIALADPFFQPEPGDEHGNGGYFLRNGSAVLTTGIATVCLTREAPGRSLNDAFNLLSSPEAWQRAVAFLKGGDGPARRLGESVSHMIGKELASTMATVAQRTRFALSPSVCDLMARSTFDAGVINREPCAIYLVGPAFRAAELAPLVRMYLGLFLRARLRAGLGHPLPIHVVADETRLLGHMSEIDTILTMGRGYNVKLQLYYQDEGQLVLCFPADKGARVKANTARVYFAVNHYDTAKSISDSLGSYTGVLRSGGTSTGVSEQRTGQGQSSSLTHNVSSNWGLHEEKLARPEQILNDFPRSTAVVFAPGVRPILTRLRPLYERHAETTAPWWRPWQHLLVALGLTTLLAGLAVELTQALRAAPTFKRRVTD